MDSLEDDKSPLKKRYKVERRRSLFDNGSASRNISTQEFSRQTIVNYQKKYTDKIHQENQEWRSYLKDLLKEEQSIKSNIDSLKYVTIHEDVLTNNHREFIQLVKSRIRRNLEAIDSFCDKIAIAKRKSDCESELELVERSKNNIQEIIYRNRAF